MYKLAITLLFMYSQFCVNNCVFGQITRPPSQIQIAATKLAALSSANRWNGNRMRMAHNIGMRITCNVRIGTDTFINVWSKLGGFNGVLGSSSQTTALLYDWKNLSTGTVTGTLVYSNDSFGSNGTTGWYNTGIAMTNGTVSDLFFGFYSTTNLGIPANIPAVMSGVTNATIVLSLKATGGTGNGTNKVNNYSSGTVTNNYSSSQNTIGFFTNGRTSSTNIRLYYQQSTLSNTTNSSTSQNPGNMRIFGSGNAAFAIAANECLMYYWGNALTDAEVYSIHRVGQFKFDNL